MTASVPRSTQALVSLLSERLPRPMLDVASHQGAIARAVGCTYVDNDLTSCAGAREAGAPSVVHADLLPDGPFGTICFDARSYDPALAAETVAQAAGRLAPDGVLMTTARLADVAPLFRDVTEDGEALVARGPIPGVATLSAWPLYDVEYGGQRYAIQSAPGVFSPRGLDEGTRLMLAQIRPQPGARFLDLGCGTGVVSRIAADGWGCEVTAVDVSARALRLAAVNAPAARVIASDGLAAVGGERFDIIASNPPYHTDFGVARTFIEGAYRQLTPGGTLYLVVKRADWYVRKVRDLFGGCRITEEQGYTVIAAERREHRAGATGAVAPAPTTRKHAKRQAAAGTRPKRPR